MAEAVQEKSRGMKFAEQQLVRHGWIQGKGLGREENGISEAIKVKVKCDKDGIGHKKGEEFTFHWWDHVFNQASASLQVEANQNGVKVKKTVEESQEVMISNKKPRKATLSKDKMYGCFVKSATLLSGQEQPEPKSSMLDDSSSSDDDEDRRLDLSSTTKLSDADLVKACGGRTAHKGARHGLTMSAKLARLEQQEAEFMAKYGKKGQSTTSSEGSAPASHLAAPAPESQNGARDVSRSKKSKKKKSRKDADEDVKRLKCEASPESCGTVDSKLKKTMRKGARSKEGGDEIAIIPEEESGPVVHVEDAARKRKKGKKNRKGHGEAPDTEAPAEKNTGDNGEISSEQQTEPISKKKKKKKKKKKRSSKERRDPADTEQHDTEFDEECLPKNQRKGGEGLPVRQRRKKCKDDRKALDCVNEEVPPPKKKKKSKE